VEDLTNSHHKKVEDIENNHARIISCLTVDWTAKFNDAAADMKTNIDRLNKEKEALRKCKDDNIRNIEQEKEDQRVHYESIINELDLKLKSKTFPTINKLF
jgi:maltodextrin utilization protein YvdJ